MTITKGIVLAGGSGTRLCPITLGPAKQLLPIYNKPMIYYPLRVLMLAGIRDILMISTPEAQPNFKHLLGNGDRLAFDFSMASSLSPKDWRRRLSSAVDSSTDGPGALVLGDNIFFGHGLPESDARRDALRRRRPSSPSKSTVPNATALSTIDGSGRAACDRGEAAQSAIEFGGRLGSISTTSASATSRRR